MSMLLSLSLRLLVPAAFAWLAIRIFRIRHAASQHAAWTAVLACMLLLPALTALQPLVNGGTELHRGQAVARAIPRARSMPARPPVRMTDCRSARRNWGGYENRQAW